MIEDRTLVMKFGGAAVQDVACFSRIAQIIARLKKKHCKILVVVSAMGSSTDALIEMAHKIHPNPPQREKDMLISVGERVSSSLLAMALDRMGVEAISFTGSQSGIITDCAHSNARILDVRPKRIEEHLDLGKVVIVAGFQGVSLQKEITTLGRGGSDRSAVALGIALKADFVEFYKDVEGIFEQDPKKYPEAKRYEKLSFTQALELAKGERVLEQAAIRLAADNQMPLYVRSFLFLERKGTWVGERTRIQVEPLYEGGVCG